MVLEATMIALDNSEAMRNGDYAPTRFQAQADAVNLLCGAKTQVRAGVPRGRTATEGACGGVRWYRPSSPSAGGTYHKQECLAGLPGSALCAWSRADARLRAQLAAGALGGARGRSARLTGAVRAMFLSRRSVYVESRAEGGRDGRARAQPCEDLKLSARGSLAAGRPAEATTRSGV